ncbi:MAG: amidohydrolase [Gudongella sp.]|nr:amidohydrolase [Gudongella sp.]
MGIENTLISMRREFHKIAETGWLEFETTTRIIDYLKEMDYKVEYGKAIHGTRMGLPTKEEMVEHSKNLNLKKDYDISEILEGYTGAIAKLETGKPGPTIAMRFDIDSNGVEESSDPTHIPMLRGFRSKNPSSMHACGHDGHTAIGLGVAKWIMKNKETLKGNYILIFQPAEEGVRGAHSIVEKNFLKGVDYFLSGHIGMGVEEGVVALGTTGFLATTKFDIFFKGIPSHAGASPELGRNALLAASSCALNLHTLTQFSSGLSRINVGTLVAGSGRNVVPANAKMQIETRSDNEKTNALLVEKVNMVVEGSAKTFGVDFEIKPAGSAPAYNTYDQDFVYFIKDSLESSGFRTTQGLRLGGSEDVAYMLQDVENTGGKTAYMIFGTNLSAPHHNNLFDFDENVLKLAYDAYTKLIDAINEKKSS